MLVENTENQSGTTAEVEISPDEATDEELDQLLAASVEEPTANAEPTAPEPSETNGAQPVQPQQLPQASQQAQQPAPQAPAPPKAQAQPQNGNALGNKHQAILQQLKQQELFIQRRNNEIGQLRQQLREANAKLQERLDERFMESPSAAMRDQAQIQQNEQRLQGLESEEQQIHRVHNAQKVFFSHIKPEDAGLDEMAQCLVDDGVPQDFVIAFKQNPWTTAAPETLVHLARRARAEKVLAQVVVYAKQLKAENEKLKGQPQQMLNKVQQALRTTPQVSAATGGSAAEASPEMPTDLTEWTSEQIDEFLKRSK